MADAVDLHAYWFATEFTEMNAVEFDGWRLEEWPDVGDVVMAYERGGGEWLASHYYRPGELCRDGPGAPRRGDGGERELQRGERSSGQSRTDSLADEAGDGRD